MELNVVCGFCCTHVWCTCLQAVKQFLQNRVHVATNVVCISEATHAHCKAALQRKELSQVLATLTTVWSTCKTTDND